MIQRRSAPCASRTAAALACLLLAPTAAQSQTSETPWPQFLGAGSDLTADAAHLAAGGGVPRAAIRWRRSTGPGYSQPIIGDGVAFVAASDNANDVVVALSLDTGEPLWSYTIGPTWRGVDGSDDGPISSPALGPGALIGLGPRGQLFALNRRTGTELWRVDLPGTHGAELHTYGVATSPLIVGDLAIVQMGAGNDRSVAAFHLESGRLAWSSGEDSVTYQSPLVANLLGVRQLLAVTATRVSGLDLSEGTELWRAEHHAEAEVHGNPAVITGASTFVVTGADDTVAFEVERQSGVLAARSVWRSRELKRSYAVPVFRDGTLYGWSGDFFAAVDAGTGERLWKTRGVGPGSLLSLSDWLVIWTVDGRLLFSRPTPESYQQVAEYSLASEGSLVNPVWTGEGLLVRARDELLAIDVSMDAASSPPTRTTALPAGAVAATGRMAALIDSVERADATTKAELIDRFLAENRVPLIEGSNVTFLWNGEAEDVALVPGGIPVETAQPMLRLEGTDLWWRSERLNRRGAYVYHFEIDGERPHLDPRNQQRATTILPSSLLTMPGYRPAAALAPGAEEPAARGSLSEHTFASELMENERIVAVYTPPGYSTERTYPLVLVTSGMDRFMGRMPDILDASMGHTVEPAVVVFVDVSEPVDMNIFYESLGGRGPLYGDMLVEEVLPWIEERYKVTDRRGDRVIMGTMLLASRALDVALRHPQLFGAVAAQSPMMTPAFEREITRSLAGAEDPPQIYIDWCEKDSVALAESTVVEPAVERLLPKLRAAGASVTARELPGGYGWEMFSAQTEAILRRYLPLREGAR